MFSKVKRRISRAGFETTKVILSVELLQLQLTVSSKGDESEVDGNVTIREGNAVVVSLERGSKCTSINPIEVKVTSDDSEGCHFDNPLNKINKHTVNTPMVKRGFISILQRLQVVATLYKEPISGCYQEKFAKLKLKIFKSMINSKEKHTMSHSIPIHDLATKISSLNHTATEEMNIPFQLSSTEKVYLKVIVHAHALSQGNGNDIDETMSVSSIISGSLAESDPYNNEEMEEVDKKEDKNAGFDYDDLYEGNNNDRNTLRNIPKRQRNSFSIARRSSYIEDSSNISHSALSPTTSQSVVAGSASLRPFQHRSSVVLRARSHLDGLFASIIEEEEHEHAQPQESAREDSGERGHFDLETRISEIRQEMHFSSPAKQTTGLSFSGLSLQEQQILVRSATRNRTNTTTSKNSNTNSNQMTGSLSNTQSPIITAGQRKVPEKSEKKKFSWLMTLFRLLQQQINSQLQQINSQRDQINSQQDQLNSQLRQINSQREQLNSQRDQLSSQREQLTLLSGNDQLAEQLQDLTAERDTYKRQCEDLRAELLQVRSQLQQSISENELQVATQSQMREQLRQLQEMQFEREIERQQQTNIEESVEQQLHRPASGVEVGVNTEESLPEFLTAERDDDEESFEPRASMFISEPTMRSLSLSQSKTVVACHDSSSEILASSLLNINPQNLHDYEGSVLQQVIQELDRCKQELEEMHVLRKLDDEAIKDAATKIVDACMVRAELEYRLLDAVQDYEELRVIHEIMRSEFDEELRKSTNYKHKLQSVMEQYTQLEVKYATAKVNSAGSKQESASSSETSSAVNGNEKRSRIGSFNWLRSPSSSTLNQQP